MINLIKRKEEIIKILQVERITKSLIVFNIFYALVMLINDIPYLFLCYFMLAGLFLLSLVFAKSNLFNACVYTYFFAGFMFSSTSIYYLGWGYGFEYYILSMIGYCHIGIYNKKWIVHIIAFLSLVYYLLMYYLFYMQDYSLNIPLYLFGEQAKVYFEILNALVICIIFVVVSNVLRRQIHIELEQRQTINKELDINANFDYLTMLMNRRNFLNSIEDLRIKDKVNIALIDIDFFKKVNDTYGHSLGDEVLKTCADMLRKHFKKCTELICRWGGEEFLILAQNISESEFEKICEDFRQDYANASFSIEGLKSSVSIGFIYISSGFASNIIDEFITKVDRCLYSAKSSGRNKIVKDIL